MGRYSRMAAWVVELVAAVVDMAAAAVNDAGLLVTLLLLWCLVW